MLAALPLLFDFFGLQIDIRADRSLDLIAEPSDVRINKTAPTCDLVDMVSWIEVGYFVLRYGCPRA